MFKAVPELQGPCKLQIYANLPEPEHACCERRKQDTPCGGDTGSMRKLWSVNWSRIWMNLVHIPESLTSLSPCSLHSFWPNESNWFLLYPFVSFCILSWFCIQALLICKTSSSHSICCAASTTVACNFTLIPAITPPSDPTPTLGATASPAPFKARINVQILTSIVSWTRGKRCPILW